MGKLQKSIHQSEVISDDEVDIFHHAREKILFTDIYNSSDLEHPEFLKQTEVLPLYGSSDENSSVQDEDEEDSPEADIKAWGRKKRIFYSSDKLDQKEELAECIRLQKEQKSRLKSSDYYHPGLLNPLVYYKKIPFEQCTATFSYFKNGRFIENSNDLSLVTRRGNGFECDNDIEVGTESETENSSSACSRNSEEEIYSNNTSSHRIFKANQPVNDSDGDYYEYVSALKRKKEVKDNENDEYIYDRYNDIDPETKRPITYGIRKNKGLLPTRTKEQRNPRVKQRKRYEKAMKRIKGFKPIVSSSGHGASYVGERSGIRSNIVKSTRF